MEGTPKHRFFVSKDNIQDNNFYIVDASITNKIRNVLRLKNQDFILLIDNESVEYIAQLGKIRKDFVAGKILEKKASNLIQKQKPQLIIAQALTKPKKIDSLIKMNSEIGASKFVFFDSTFAQIKSKQIKTTKLERWQTIATEAARQSERTKIPQVIAPVTFEKLFDIKADVKLAFHSRKTSSSIDLKDLEKIRPDQTILTTFGPEGGFTGDEIKSFEHEEFKIINLDLNILRVETASVAASSIILGCLV